MNKQIPICKNCKHVRYNNTNMVCGFAQVEQINIYNGETKYHMPRVEYERGNKKWNIRNNNIPFCGQECKHFEYDTRWFTRWYMVIFNKIKVQYSLLYPHKRSLVDLIIYTTLAIILILITKSIISLIMFFIVFSWFTFKLIKSYKI